MCASEDAEAEVVGAILLGRNLVSGGRAPYHRPGAQGRYECIVDTHLVPFFAGVKLADVDDQAGSPLNVKRYAATLRQACFCCLYRYRGLRLSTELSTGSTSRARDRAVPPLLERPPYSVMPARANRNLCLAGLFGAEVEAGEGTRTLGPRFTRPVL